MGPVGDEMTQDDIVEFSETEEDGEAGKNGGGGAILAAPGKQTPSAKGIVAAQEGTMIPRLNVDPTGGLVRPSTIPLAGAGGSGKKSSSSGARSGAKAGGTTATTVGTTVTQESPPVGPAGSSNDRPQEPSGGDGNQPGGQGRGGGPPTLTPVKPPVIFHENWDVIDTALDENLSFAALEALGEEKAGFMLTVVNLMSMSCSADCLEEFGHPGGTTRQAVEKWREYYQGPVENAVMKEVLAASARMVAFTNRDSALEVAWNQPLRAVKLEASESVVALATRRPTKLLELGGMRPQFEALRAGRVGREPGEHEMEYRCRWLRMYLMGVVELPEIAGPMQEAKARYFETNGRPTEEGVRVRALLKGYWARLAWLLERLSPMRSHQVAQWRLGQEALRDAAQEEAAGARAAQEGAAMAVEEAGVEEQEDEFEELQRRLGGSSSSAGAARRSGADEGTREARNAAFRSPPAPRSMFPSQREQQSNWLRGATALSGNRRPTFARDNKRLHSSLDDLGEGTPPAGPNGDVADRAEDAMLVAMALNRIQAGFGVEADVPPRTRQAGKLAMVTVVAPGESLVPGVTLLLPVRFREGRARDMSLQGTNPTWTYEALTEQDVRLAVMTCTRRVGHSFTLEYLQSIGDNECHRKDVVANPTGSIRVDTGVKLFIALSREALDNLGLEHLQEPATARKGGVGIYPGPEPSLRDAQGASREGRIHAFDFPPPLMHTPPANWGGDRDELWRGTSGTREQARLIGRQERELEQLRRQVLQEQQRANAPGGATMLADNDGVQALYTKYDEKSAELQENKPIRRMSVSMDHIIAVTGKMTLLNITAEAVSASIIKLTDPTGGGVTAIAPVIDRLCEVQVVAPSKIMQLYRQEWVVLALRGPNVLTLDWCLSERSGPAWKSQVNIQTALEGAQRLYAYLYGWCWGKCFQHIIEVLCSTTTELHLDEFFVVARIEAQLEKFASELRKPNSFGGRCGEDLVADFQGYLSLVSLNISYQQQDVFMKAHPEYSADMTERLHLREVRAARAAGFLDGPPSPGRGDRRGGRGEDRDRGDDRRGRDDRDRGDDRRGRDAKGGAPKAGYNPPHFTPRAGWPGRDCSNGRKLQACHFHFRFRYGIGKRDGKALTDCKFIGDAHNRRCESMHIEDFVYNRIPKAKAVLFVPQGSPSADAIREGMRADKELLDA